ncbi:hypothetical protein [Xanthomonas albilineans]|uniref:hypothetical protein n=1 Tax=Xanthomonas albilineans TaxID=29447 RepID=UPI001E2BC4D9|nr:hypothetical protein [Xanthomonas albilineans]
MPEMQAMLPQNGERNNKMQMKAKCLAWVVIAAGCALSFQASAQTCCPGGGHGISAANGLGESTPQAVTLAPNPDLRIFEVQRDGVRYLQVKDAGGRVRVAVGRIGAKLWVLPMGSDVARVSVSSSASASEVYLTTDFVIRRRSGVHGDEWEITARD